MGLARQHVPKLIGAVGLAFGCALQAQTLPPAPQYTYDVVSIRPSQAGQTESMIGPGPQGGIRTQNTAVMQLLTVAYDVKEFQFADIPKWVKSERYDVSFTPDKPEIALGPVTTHDQMVTSMSRQRQRLQAVLRDRFGLVLRAETREMPVYALTIAKGGHKLTPANNPSDRPVLKTLRGQVSGTAVTPANLAIQLAGLLERPVIDETGLTGAFNFKLEWTPDSATTSAIEDTSIFTAVTEQLGLKLTAKKELAQVFVIETIKKPKQN